MGELSKNKPRVIHFKLIDGDKTTACGKTARGWSCLKTTTLDKVTCRRCLEYLQANNWYCEEHGFINDETVTNNETCEICGRAVG